jgi:polyribonucleotide nucleotidyltransferase
MERARQMVSAITAEPEIGATYEGTVKSTTPFGAFIEIMPGTEALLHISEMQHGRTEKTEDVVKKGDRVTVKLIDKDERGRLRLSRKALLPKPEGLVEESGGDGGGEGGGNGQPGGGRGGRGPRREPRGASDSEGGESRGGERGERAARPGGGRGGERSRRS